MSYRSHTSERPLAVSALPGMIVALLVTAVSLTSTAGEAGSGSLLHGVGSAGGRAAAIERSPDPAPGKFLRLATGRRAFYVVDGHYLAAAGLKNSSGLQLECLGVPQPVIVEAGVRGAPGGVIFFGREFADRYTDENVYWLSAGKGRSARRSLSRLLVGARGAAARGARWLGGVGRPGGSAAPAGCTQTVTVDRDERYLPGFRNPEAGETRWFFEPMLGRGASLDVEAELHDPLEGTAATLTVALRSLVEFPGLDPDHRVLLSVNGNQVGSLSWDGARRYVGSVELSSDLLTGGANDLAVTVDGESGDGFDLIVVDSFELSYDRALRAVGDELDAELRVRRGRRFRIEGFASRRVLAVDATDRSAPVFCPVVCIPRSDGSVAVEVTAVASGVRRIYAAGESAWRRPGADAMARPCVPGAKLDYLVVAPSAIIEAAGPLLALHRSKGLVAEAVSAEDVYNSAGHGIFGPAAILEYVRLRRPRYLLLLGDATYDYRGRLSDPPQGTLPTFAAQDLYFEAASDDPFRCAGLCDARGGIAVGRLPAGDLQSASAMVAKVLERANAVPSPAWKGIVAADDDEPGFLAGADELSGLLGGAVELASAASLGAAGARERLHEALLEGAWYCIYLGHGSTDRWAAEKLLSPGDAKSLEGMPLPAVSLELTCLTGRFDQNGDSLAEAMMKSRRGGFAGAIASSGMTDQPGQMALARALLARLEAGESLGEALSSAKAAMSKIHSRTAHVFNLLGDPAGH